MPQTQTHCPNCRQPMIADINQLFDVNDDPQAKERLLSGASNFVQCTHCGFQGILPTPIIYHDPEKDLLLTYFPSELQQTRDEQERVIGRMIKRVMERLKQEQRKAYLFQPQTMLTFQLLIERILEADGITKEMLKAQQERVNFIQRLLSSSEDAIKALILQEDEKLNSDFFYLFSRLMESAQLSGDKQNFERMSKLQEILIKESTYGRQVNEEIQEMEAAVQSIRKFGNELSQDKLLELVIKAPNESRVRALVGLIRPGFDYSFFQLLSERIDRARAKGRQRLIDLRERILQLTQEYDQQLEARSQIAKRYLETLLEADDIVLATQQNLPAIDDLLIKVLEYELETSRKTGDLERIEKLQKIKSVIDEALKAPPEYEMIDGLLQVATDERALQERIVSHQNEITPKLIEILSGLVTQVYSDATLVKGMAPQDQKILAENIQTVYKAVLNFSMSKSIKGE